MTLSIHTKRKNLFVRRLESIWMFAAILSLISSVMCIAVAFLALLLPGVHMAMLGFLLASVTLGLLGRWSLRKLQKRNKDLHHFLV